MEHRHTKLYVQYMVIRCRANIRAANPTISNMQVHDHSSKETTMDTIIPSLSLCQKPSHLAKELSGTHRQGYICCPKAKPHSMADTHTQEQTKGGTKLAFYPVEMLCLNKWCYRRF